MRSPMIESADYIVPEEKGGYTDLQVLMSGAGYYIGTMYEERDEKGEITWQEPGSRDSGYYATREEAQSALDLIEKGIGEPTRMTP
jgi:hypothetical protein